MLQSSSLNSDWQGFAGRFTFFQATCAQNSNYGKLIISPLWDLSSYYNLKILASLL